MERQRAETVPGLADLHRIAAWGAQVRRPYYLLQQFAHHRRGQRRNPLRVGIAFAQLTHLKGQPEAVIGFAAPQITRAVEPLPPPTFDFVVFDAVVIGAFVCISLAAAQALNLQKGHWVAVSCLAVIEGAPMRAVWSKQLQRVIGTSIGLLVSWGERPLQFTRCDEFFPWHCSDAATAPIETPIGGNP